MKFVYVLENDRRFQREISYAVSAIDPKIQVRFFPRLEQFVSWLQLAMTEGPAALTKGGTDLNGALPEDLPAEEHTLCLVVSQIEILGADQLALLKRTRQLFIERKLCTAEDPTSFVLTAFEDPDFKTQKYEDPILSNIIFKPFDRLILQQHLIFAIGGRHPAEQFAVANQKTAAIFEMLKEIKLEGVSEAAFITRADREVEVGVITKYYSPIFATEISKSVMGVVEQCAPHPKSPNEFRIWVRFFSLDPAQISSLRRRVRNPTTEDHPDMVPPVITPPVLEENFQIVIVDPLEKGPEGITNTFTRKFANATVTTYISWEEFYLQLDPPKDKKDQPTTLPKGIRAVFVHHSFLGEKTSERFEKLAEVFKNRGDTPKFFLFSSEDYSDDKERELCKSFGDIFYRPLDRNYIVRQVYRHFPGLQILAEPIEEKWVTAREVTKTANPIKVLEFSEAGFVMEYSRPIGIGSFRSVLLWQPYEIEAPELLASCNYFEEVTGGKTKKFINHFILFGMTDQYLKKIRIWIRNNYILSKEASG